MVFPNGDSESESEKKKKKVVHSLRLSSVGPSTMTGTDVVHHLTPMDLAMKLHYLTGLYYFSSQAAQGLTISIIKEAMFKWLNTYYIVCGRLKRWPETGRPHIKCNDCGVRIIEAVCDNTVQEWLSMMSDNINNNDDDEMRKLLIYHQVIGPEISFSPPCLIQITKFKCGGMSLGLSWAHVLGDAIAAIDCINMWPQFLVGSKTVSPIPSKPIPTISKSPCAAERDPVSLKRVDPVGDHWTFNAECNMKAFTFHLTHPQLNHIRLNLFKSEETPPIFESLCAVLWKLIAEAKGGDKGNNPNTYNNNNNNVVTICKNDSSRRAAGGGLSNSQKISVVKAEVVGSSPNEILGLLKAQIVEEENELIEEAVERSNGGLGDFIMYGANLTFVDLGESELYGLELNGVRPVFADYVIQGVGREGVVVVAPGPTPETGVVVTVTVVLPEELIPELKLKLKMNHLLFHNNLT